MIITFACLETKKIWEGQVSRKLPVEIQISARKKLRMLNNAHIINDLKVPPGNRLEVLKGNMSKYYSIRINDQWRFCFIWNNGNTTDVKIVDYH